LGKGEKLSFSGCNPGDGKRESCGRYSAGNGKGGSRASFEWEVLAGVLLAPAALRSPTLKMRLRKCEREIQKSIKATDSESTRQKMYSRTAHPQSSGVETRPPDPIAVKNWGEEKGKPLHEFHEPFFCLEKTGTGQD